jgi:hypothetical protein
MFQGRVSGRATAAFAALHFFVVVMCLVVGLIVAGSSSATNSSGGETVFICYLSCLMFPASLLILLGASKIPFLGLLLIPLNSVLWGMAAAWFWGNRYGTAERPEWWRD